jgi:hypothetical protein
MNAADLNAIDLGDRVTPDDPTDPAARWGTVFVIDLEGRRLLRVRAASVGWIGGDEIKGIKRKESR